MSTAMTEDRAREVLRAALGYARSGFYVVPWQVIPNGNGKPKKLPAFKGWQLSAPPAEPPDLAKVRAMWGPGGSHEGYNVGILTGWRWKDGAAVPFAAYDIDVADGRQGAESWRRLLADLRLSDGDVTTTTARTPTKGRHLLFDTRVPLGTKSQALEGYPDVDIRGVGGYIGVWPSTVNGAGYEWTDGRDPSLMPEALEQKSPRPGSSRPARDEQQAPTGDVDPKRAEARALDYLRTQEGAKKGSRGITAYKLAARLKDFGCDEDTAFVVLLNFWADKCEPQMPDDDLQESVSHAYRYGKEPLGVAAPEAQFPLVEPDEDPNAKGNPLVEMNKRFAFVLAGDSRPILQETHDEDGRPCVNFLKVEVLHNFFRNVPLQLKDKVKPVSQWWMEWRGRRQFSRVAFVPEGAVPADVFNLWSGWAVQPRLGDWSRMKAHILDVVCNGNRDLNRYVLGWLALMVQKPGTRAGTALVLRGGKGSGKGTLGDWLIRITGRHGIHVSHARHLTGHFNSHLREAMFLFADESFFAGDKQHESVLKALVTEQELVIEPKGQNAFVQRNCLHLLLASNSEWVVPASADERRYAVLDVSPCRVGDFGYFDQLADERDHGGLEAMLYDLLHSDLSGFNVWAVPTTKGLVDQKLASLRGAERWLAEILAEGGIGETPVGFTPWEAEGLSISKQQAYLAYERLAAKRYREYEPQKVTVFWRKIREIIPRLKDMRPGKDSDRNRLVVFPPLGECREAFEKHMKGEVDWN